MNVHKFLNDSKKKMLETIVKTNTAHIESGKSGLPTIEEYMLAFGLVSSKDNAGQYVPKAPRAKAGSSSSSPEKSSGAKKSEFRCQWPVARKENSKNQDPLCGKCAAPESNGYKVLLGKDPNGNVICMCTTHFRGKWNEKHSAPTENEKKIWTSKWESQRGGSDEDSDDEE